MTRPLDEIRRQARTINALSARTAIQRRLPFGAVHEFVAIVDGMAAIDHQRRRVWRLKRLEHNLPTIIDQQA